MKIDGDSSPKQQQENEEPSVSCSSSVDQQTPIPQNPVLEITNPQNPDQETSNQECPVQEVQNRLGYFEEASNPQNPFEETQNPENPVQEVSNSENPLEETQNPENPMEEQNKRQTETNKKMRTDMGVPMDPFYEWERDETDCDHNFGYDDLMHSVMEGEEEDDVKTMNYVLAYVRLGNRLPQSREDYEVLHSYISGFYECIILETLEKKLNRLKDKFFILMERKRRYPGATLTAYDDSLHTFGTEVWGSERHVKQEEAIRESMAVVVARKAKEEGNQGQEEDSILFERSTSEEDDDITTMKYCEAYVLTTDNRLKFPMSEYTSLLPYSFICNQGEEIKLEVLKRKVVELRIQYSMLRDRFSTDPNATYTPYEVEMHRLGREVWGLELHLLGKKVWDPMTHRRKRILWGTVPTISTSIDAPFSLIEHGNDDMELEQANLLSIMPQESSHVINESQLLQLKFGGIRGNENKQKRRQQEVEVALHHLYGERGDEWTKEYKMMVEVFHMDDEKDQGKNEELCKEKSSIFFDDDWEVAEDCILYTVSKSEEEDDIMTLKCVKAYTDQNKGEGDYSFEVLYGVISRHGVITNLEVLKKKLAKMLRKYVMLMEKVRLNGLATLTDNEKKFHELGTEVWGSTRPDGTSTLLDSKGIVTRDAENATIFSRRRKGRPFRISEDPTIRLSPTSSSPSSFEKGSDSRSAFNLERGSVFKISQDPTTGRSRIMPASTPTSVDEAFYSRPAINLNRRLAIRDAEKPADDQPPEAVEDVKGNGKRQAESRAPNKRPRKFQRAEELLLLFQEAQTEDEDDLQFLRYASAYRRNVTSPTAAGLYKFILANLKTGEGISWFLLKLKLAMLESRYLSILRVLDSNGNMAASDMGYYSDLYRLGRECWDDEIADNNPDGGASGSGSGGGA